MGRRIRELRGFDKTQIDFARRIGVTQGYLSSAERGQREIGPEILLRISSQCGKSLDWLLPGKEFSMKLFLARRSFETRVPYSTMFGCRVQCGSQSLRHRRRLSHSRQKPGRSSPRTLCFGNVVCTKGLEHTALTYHRNLGDRG